MEDYRYVESILKGIVLNPSHLRIQRTEDARGILFRINVAKPDMPFLVGKEGKNIDAIRLIMKLYAKGGTSISVKLEEPLTAS